MTNAAASLQDLPADLRFSITDQPGPQAYPIAGSTWVLLYRTQPDAEQGKLVTAFIQWAITDGQKYANDLDYAVLSQQSGAESGSRSSNRHVRRKALSAEVGIDSREGGNPCLCRRYRGELLILGAV